MPKREIIIPVGPSIAYVPLTQGQFALISRSDVPLLSNKSWYAKWNPNSRSYYARCDRNTGMHQIVFGEKGPDHINHNTLDNRRENLRRATLAQNQWNCIRHIANGTGAKNVYYTRNGKYAASLAVNKMRLWLGIFDNLEAAKEAVRKARVHHHGEFANHG